jgi:hypothetical protein
MRRKLARLLRQWAERLDPYVVVERQEPYEYF